LNRICKVIATIALGLTSASASAQVAGGVNASSGGEVRVASPAAATSAAGSVRAEVGAASRSDAAADTAPSAVGDVKRAIRKPRPDAPVATNSGAATAAGSTAKSSGKSPEPSSGD